MFASLLLVSTIALAALAIQLYRERQRLRYRLRLYDGISSREEYERRLDNHIDSQRRTVKSLQQEVSFLERQIREMETQVSGLEDEDYFRSVGFYEAKYSFIDSESYKQRLSQLIAERKQLSKNGQAAICSQSWSIRDSTKEEERMIKNHLKMILDFFNMTCDTALKEVKTRNINQLREKIRKVFDRLNTMSSILQCHVTEEYLKGIVA